MSTQERIGCLESQVVYMNSSAMSDIILIGYLNIYIEKRTADKINHLTNTPSVFYKIIKIKFFCMKEYICE